MSHHHDHHHTHHNSHHHHNDHHHHDHDHHHHDHQTYSIESQLSFEEKMLKLFNHWLTHNESHIGTYLEWADQSEKKGLSEISKLLKEVSEDSKAINQKFEQAISILTKSKKTS